MSPADILNLAPANDLDLGNMEWRAAGSLSLWGKEYPPGFFAPMPGSGTSSHCRSSRFDSGNSTLEQVKPGKDLSAL